MFIKNRDAIFSLARNANEKSILLFLIDKIDEILSNAQPSKLLATSISFGENSFKVQDTEFSFSSYNEIYLIAFGKASQPMAAWMTENSTKKFKNIIISSPSESSGKYNNESFCSFYKAGHPKPDNKSLQAAEEVLNLLRSLKKDDLCIFLISGGGSSLLDFPDFNVPFNDYLLLMETMLSCGAPIHEINTVRKHFSKTKGGKFCINTRASIVSLIISDVIGNDISTISSGPTVPDKTTWNDCWQIFQKYGLIPTLPDSILFVINKGINGTIPDTPSDSVLFSRVHNFMIGDNQQLLERTKDGLDSAITASVVDYALQGEASAVGENLAHFALTKYSNRKKGSEQFLVFLFGGETTVTLQSKSSSKGGRNQELALSFALTINKEVPVFMIALGTDGIDGSSSAAGAIVGPFTLSNLQKREKALRCLEQHDSNRFFRLEGGEILTGHTGTNLMDIIIILIEQIM